MHTSIPDQCWGALAGLCARDGARRARVPARPEARRARPVRARPSRTNERTQMPSVWRRGWKHVAADATRKRALISSTGTCHTSSKSSSESVGRCLALLIPTFLACAISTADAATDAELAACTASYETYLVGRASLIEDCQIGGGTVGEYRSNCPPGMQSLIDDAYADCGGLVIAWRGVDSIDWDSEMGGRIKYEVAKCGCSQSSVTLPAFAALTLLHVVSWLSIA
eukprot:COSAG02_NODE_3537_length_6594_cov_4.011239_4_plen_226_part_00